jgi:hypothetical protein
MAVYNGIRSSPAALTGIRSGREDDCQSLHVLGRLVERWADDVRWRLIVQLLDALAEVSLCDANPSPLQERTMMEALSSTSTRLSAILFPISNVARRASSSFFSRST